jgi:hypothetical protein
MPTKVRALLIGLLLCSGCDNPAVVPAGGGGSDYLPYLQSMTKVSVTFTGQTLHHAYLKQGCLDPGNTSDLWLIRQHEYQNRDSAYTIIWQDSFFSTKACFILRQLDPSFTIASDCGDNSLIRGVYHSGTKSISDLLCLFQKCEGFQDPANYKAQSAFLKAPSIELEALSYDSVSFVIKNWGAESLSIGYNNDELSFSTYIRQIRMTAFDSLGKTYPPVCRAVFFK